VIITVASTVVGILISIPIGLGAARNIAPLPVYLVCRGIVALSRRSTRSSSPSCWWRFSASARSPGFLTLSFATIGFLSKLLAEDIEEMDKVQAEAIRATGASWLQWINYGVQPQVMPRLIGLSMYRLDINFRESAVLGLVGAGGIGATLNTAFDRYEFDTAGSDPADHHRHRDGAGISLRHHQGKGAVMPDLKQQTAQDLAVARPQPDARALGGYLVAVAVFMWCWQRISEATTWFFVWDAPRIAADIGGRAWPPRWSYMDNLWGPLVGHAQHGDAGHPLALVMAVPVAFLAARNTTPSAPSSGRSRCSSSLPPARSTR
jgi:ABC-type phosphate/phosphonate transport system permease subunit